MICRNTLKLPSGAIVYECQHTGRLLIDPAGCADCPYQGESASLSLQPTVVIPPSQPRPDLKSIETTLPAPTPKDAERTFKRPVFHEDGSIEYPRQEGDWEIPMVPQGYARDPENKFKLLPLWNFCQLRSLTAAVKENCGCLDVVAKCVNPAAPSFGQRLAHATCESCPVRTC